MTTIEPPERVWTVNCHVCSFNKQVRTSRADADKLAKDHIHGGDTDGVEVIPWKLSERTADGETAVTLATDHSRSDSGGSGGADAGAGAGAGMSAFKSELNGLDRRDERRRGRRRTRYTDRNPHIHRNTTRYAPDGGR